MLNMTAGNRNRRSFIALSELDDRTEFGIQRGFFDLGNDLSKELSQEMLKKNKLGRVYVTRNKAGARRRHRASAPGQTAANFSGTMRKSRGFVVKGDQLEFGLEAEYAAYLESGTRNISARPTIRKAVMATERNGASAFAKNIERSLSKLP